MIYCGYMSKILILPFDHRSTFTKNLLGFDYPPTKSQAKQVIKMKKVVFDAFLLARKQTTDKNKLAILIDEEFGVAIIKKARRLKINLAISTEKSGQELFTFEHGDDFGKHLTKLKPTYAKALVRYNPAQTAKNKIQLSRLKKLSNYCQKNKIGFMFELLVAGKGSQLELMERSMKQVIKAGIKPTLWKIEGLPKASDWKTIDALTKADIIVLGRGESKMAVEKWITEAAKSDIVDGFAIGRTIFFKPLEEYRDKKINRTTAVEKITKNYLHFINLWGKNIKR